MLLFLFLLPHLMSLLVGIIIVVVFSRFFDGFLGLLLLLLSNFLGELLGSPEVLLRFLKLNLLDLDLFLGLLLCQLGLLQLLLGFLHGSFHFFLFLGDSLFDGFDLLLDGFLCFLFFLQLFHFIFLDLLDLRFHFRLITRCFFVVVVIVVVGGSSCGLGRFRNSLDVFLLLLVVIVVVFFGLHLLDGGDGFLGDGVDLCLQDFGLFLLSGCTLQGRSAGFSLSKLLLQLLGFDLSLLLLDGLLLLLFDGLGGLFLVVVVIVDLGLGHLLFDIFFDLLFQIFLVDLPLSEHLLLLLFFFLDLLLLGDCLLHHFLSLLNSEISLLLDLLYLGSQLLIDLGFHLLELGLGLHFLNASRGLDFVLMLFNDFLSLLLLGFNFILGFGHLLLGFLFGGYDLLVLLLLLLLFDLFVDLQNFLSFLLLDLGSGLWGHFVVIVIFIVVVFIFILRCLSNGLLHSCCFLHCGLRSLGFGSCLLGEDRLVILLIVVIVRVCLGSFFSHSLGNVLGNGLRALLFLGGRINFANGVFDDIIDDLIGLLAIGIVLLHTHDLLQAGILDVLPERAELLLLLEVLDHFVEGIVLFF
mmetsp:Transcript_20706/g.31718  ORF Transcript_20706/g.31718 Transcript_20706/m.31718 type:complete len:580 (+) Transcript_20706:660-2399(+)